MNRIEPQEGPQTDLLTVPVQDILFGGARGGGKSHGVLLHWLQKAHQVGQEFETPGIFKGILFRRTFAELEDIIDKAKQLFLGLANWKATAKKFIFHTNGPYRGAVLSFRFIERDSDTDKYQGHEYQWICFEEAGNFASPIPVDKLRATRRSSHGTPTYFIMTANPGGVGHQWIKAEYVSPATPGTPFIHTTTVGDTEYKEWRLFLPSKLSDNKILTENDPNYKASLVKAAAGQEWLLKAWLDGDWDIIAGGMFDDIWRSDIHILPPFRIPSSWDVYRAYDWGSSKPFSIGWWAVSDGTAVRVEGHPNPVVYPRGTIFRVAEWYGSTGKPNEGLKMAEREIAEGIVERERNFQFKVSTGPADVSIFDTSRGIDLAKIHKEKGVYWKPADKSPGSRVRGWQLIRQLLLSARERKPEEPGLYVFSHCHHFIRTIPTLQRDNKNMDDVATETEDHIADEMRYMVLYNRPKVRRKSFSGV